MLEDLKRYSKETKIYALEDDAYIIMDNKETKFFGNIYLIEDENVIKIKRNSI